MARRRKHSIPLRLRLPNAPATFVGRLDDVDRLSRILERGAFAAVVGPGGIGKTALVLETISRCFPDAIDRAFYFAVPRDEPLEQLCRTLLYALAAHLGREDELDLVAVQTDLALCFETLFELAAEIAPWIVLDDVHHVTDGDAEDLLLPFAAYARSAKLVATTRRPLRAANLAERSVALGRLSESDLLGLARALEPALAEHRSHGLVAAAGGSPWVLKQVLARGVDDAVTDSRRELLGGLGEDELRLVESLAWLRSAVPHELLRLLTPRGERVDLEPLLARGLATITPEGARIHDVVLDLLGSDFADPERRERATMLRARLAASESPGAQLEALKLSLRLGDVAITVALLDEHGEGMLARGYAPRLFRELRDVHDATLAVWKMRCAAELGNATVLDSVGQLTLEHDVDRLAWANARYLSGEPGVAAELARDLARRSTSAPLRVEASLLVARALLASGTPEAALAALSSATTSARARTIEALCHARLGSADAEALLGRMLSASEGLDPVALLDVAEARLAIRQHEQALELLDRVGKTPRGGSAAHVLGRRGLLLRAEIRIGMGRLDEAAALVEAVRPYVRGPSLLRARLLRLDAERRLVAGELEGLESVIEQAASLCAVADVAGLGRIEVLRSALAAAHRRSPGRAPPRASTELVHHARWGSDVALASDTPRDPHDELLAASHTALLAGDAAGAAEVASRALRSPGTRQSRSAELEARCALCDALLADAREDDLASEAQRLLELAEEMGSGRYASEAAFYRAPSDLGNLERLAPGIDRAPAAALRSRRLLGGDAACDLVDEIVVAAIQRSWGARRVTTVTGATARWTPGWGVHTEERAVWLPDGRWISFVRKPVLWKLVACLADAGGGAVDKETLALRVWEERRYDPRLHDSKLHVAVRALRQEIEDDPARPERFVTTPDGYALGGLCRRFDPAPA